jgi:hypothetical protein
MDQGLHNWLVYTGLLDMFMNVKVSARGLLVTGRDSFLHIYIYLKCPATLYSHNCSCRCYVRHARCTSRARVR